MEKCSMGLEVPKDETSICVRNLTGDVLSTARAATDPDKILKALSKHMGLIQCVVLETGRMANWLYNELSDRDLPVVYIDARQAHAVISQMHNKTDDNDAAMLAELARSASSSGRLVRTACPTGSSSTKVVPTWPVCRR